ncbi:uncharacterized protein DUF3606 [Mesorhizobium loti]|jgi:hypothetical protein|uniref:Uncharacterized protein DUF3606 n=1 Tax=Rhizobium loti TaxID=381 RepID=A0A8E2W7K8_RHILI|nr:uncharacterized protein DUF3606 [Mesorhizobium loti]
MADDKSKRDFRDRDRVAGDQEYEVAIWPASSNLRFLKCGNL